MFNMVSNQHKHVGVLAILESLPISCKRQIYLGDILMGERCRKKKEAFSLMHGQTAPYKS